jgi:hypothetical protein
MSMKPTIKAVCLDCSRMHNEGKELKIITSTRTLSLHHKIYPTHLIEMIEAGDYDRKTGFPKLEPKK